MTRGNRLLILLMLFIFFPAGESPAGSGKPPIKVGTIFSLTGEASAASLEHNIAARFGINEINRSGGLLGRQIRIIEIDNRSTALGSRYAAQEAVREKVSAVIGGSWSSHAMAMAPVLQEAGIPMITPLATNPMVTRVGNCIFRVCFVDTFQGEMLARFFHEDLKAGTAAVLTNADQVYSMDLSRQFIKAFQSLGHTVSVQLNYLETAPDFSPLIRRLSGYPFDAVLLPGYTRDSAQIIRTARNMGMAAPFVGGDGWSHLMLNYTGEEMNNTFYMTHWHRGQDDKRSRDFVQKVSKIFVPGKINAGMALSYDAVYLLADAVQRSGSDRPDNIRQALAATDKFTGVTGTIRFDENRNPIKPAVILKFRGRKTSVIRRITP